MQAFKNIAYRSIYLGSQSNTHFLTLLLQHALLAKISRERIGIEVDKMLRGPAPRRSLELIYSFGLYEVTFAPPQNNVQGELQDTQRSVQAAKLVEW
jgi:tRNA nucleotidyltransferase/poly(A) polymerase